MGRARRAKTAAALGVLVTVSGLVASFGCTLLVSFDDKPHDAGSQVDPDPDPSTTSPVPTFTSTVPTSTSTTPVPVFDAGNTCDRTLNPQQITGCQDFTVPNAQVCATNASLSPYPFGTTRSRDLVTCNAGSAICVLHCPTTCAALPNGFPDQCDQCAGKNGAYCGSELGWTGKSADLLTHCSGGTLSAAEPPRACANRCVTGSAQGTATCQ